MRIRLGTRSFAADKNSITGPLAIAERDMSGVMKVLSAMRNASSWLNPMAYVGAAIEHAGNVLMRQRNEQMMRTLGANTHNPGELLDAISRIEAAQKRSARSRTYVAPETIQRYVPPAAVAASPFVGVERREE